ncbi:MAG: family 43 glycosylhydrolase [Bacteroidales bacterium]|nr:family 43 glycosylhydrolase [Bacteroidales bacterium]
MKRLLLITALLPAVVYAQNPVIRDIFAADPTARVFNGKVYLFPSHDILQPVPLPAGQQPNWFCMEDYHVFSSENLTEWTDHGMILHQKDVPWGNPNAYSMWAPDCIERNGKYYFYFPDAPKDGRGFGIGVAIADKPEGPYTPVKENIKGISGIDPCVLQASDGNAYIFWGAGRCAKLKENMVELADDTPKETVKWGNREFEMYGYNCLKDLPNRQAEGPFAFEYNGNYYLTYPYVRRNTEVLGYAMSKNPTGPYEYKGLIMAEHADSCWTNHHSIINYKGQWYLFYHHNDYSPNDDKRRSVRIEKLYFNPDGTIKEVKPTMRGVGINNALSRIDVDRYNTASNDVTTGFVDTADTFKGWFAGLKQKGSNIVYKDVDFSKVKNRAYAIATVRANKNTKFSIREKSPKGKVLAQFTVTVVTEGQFRRDYSGQWLAVTAPLTYVPSGVTDLCVVADAEGLDVDAVEFKNRIEYYTNASGASSTPDADGFIHRWNVLEPINLDINTNILFTDSYLDKTLGDPKVQALLKTVPTENQKVKYNNQNLVWHKIESNFYNVKLFRFAEQYGDKIYGVIFPVTTVIECDEDLKDVRLMAGSNSASKWYLNGEEILTMSGDRRMVKDDCASKSVTLRKGTNVLSGLIINGPGMSDYCVRFIDHNGNTVKNFKVK